MAVMQRGAFDSLVSERGSAMSKASANVQMFPTIESTYTPTSPGALADALVHYGLELLNSKEMCTALPKGFRSRLLKDYVASRAMHTLIKQAEQYDTGNNLRLALYKFVCRHRTLNSLLKNKAMTEFLELPVCFTPLRPKLVADQDPFIDETYKGGRNGLISGLHDHLFEILTSPGLIELINEDIYAKLCGMRDRWDAFSAVVRSASMSERRDLRVALLHFVRACGAPLAWMLTDKSRSVVISESTAPDLENDVDAEMPLLTTEPLGRKAGINLFLAYSGMRDYDPARDSSVCDLVDRLDGHPLAIALLAQNLGSNVYASVRQLAIAYEEKGHKLLKQGAATSERTNFALAVDRSLNGEATSTPGARDLCFFLAVFPGVVSRQTTRAFLARRFLRLHSGDTTMTEIHADTATTAISKAGLAIPSRDGGLRMLAPFRDYISVSLQVGDDVRDDARDIVQTYMRWPADWYGVVLSIIEMGLPRPMTIECDDETLNKIVQLVKRTGIDAFDAKEVEVMLQQQHVYDVHQVDPNTVRISLSDTMASITDRLSFLQLQDTQDQEREPDADSVEDASSLDPEQSGGTQAWH